LPDFSLIKIICSFYLLDYSVHESGIDHLEYWNPRL
jgi:hypothetical protein